MSLQRAILHTAAICAIEYYFEFTNGEIDADLSQQMLSPTDGATIAILDRLIPQIRQSNWSSCAWGWYEPENRDSKPARDESLVRAAERWVTFRNNRIGHGVVDQSTIDEALRWLPAFARDLLAVLSDLIPVVNAGDSLYVETPQGGMQIQTLRLVDGAPIVVRGIACRGAVWRLRYQTVELKQSKEGAYELAESNPLIVALRTSKSLYAAHAILIGDEYWRPTVCLPGRVTNVFSGRREELDQLKEWFDDEDSRACLVYGEGGIGKTTLVLEFLNGFLECPDPSVKWRPDVIAFYSAKQTRWGPRGLEYIKGISPAITEAVRLLARAIEDRLDKKWYEDEPERLIDRTVELFSQVGIKRSQILLVIDNTETLARTLGEEDALTRLIGRISSRLGRVLLTSRRRERVEALPLQLLPMHEDAACALLEQLASAYDAKSLKDAGESSLRRIARRLSGRPLLLDVFARQVSHVQSLDIALSSVLQHAGAELGEFLFEDAWQRITAEQQEVFLILCRVGDTVDGQVLGWLCAEVGIPQEIWLEAFEETRFGKLIDYGSHYDVQLQADTRMFLERKYTELSVPAKETIKRLAEKVSRRYVQYLDALETDVSDRVLQAFRSAAAKAAKIAVNAGRIDDARLWFEEAVSADDKNVALWERFAWFMMMKVGDLNSAAKYAAQARKLHPKDADAAFTSGMIEARRGNVEDADKHLLEAKTLGKGGHIVALYRIRARTEALQREIRGGDSLLEEAEQLMSVARQSEETGWRSEKHMAECDRQQARINRLRERMYGKDRPAIERRRRSRSKLEAK